MNKKVYRILSLFIVVLLSLSFFACSSANDVKTDEDVDFEAAYSAAENCGYEGTYNDFLLAFSGDSAYETAVSCGYVGSAAEWLTSLVGAFGRNGTSPQIGQNGNWFVGSVDTGVRANGLSAYELYLKYNSDYEGDEAQWVEDLANGKLVRYTVTFDGSGGILVAGKTVQKIIPNSSAVAPLFEKKGYVLGWDKSFNSIVEDTTITAVWTKETSIFDEIFIKGNISGTSYFDFSIENPSFSYDYGSEENEEIFRKILGGEYNYRDYFGWFIFNPDYIYRYNEESLKLVATVINEGKMNEQLREKFGGFIVTYPHSDEKYAHYIEGTGKNGECYRVTLSINYNITEIWQTVKFDGRQNSGFDVWHVYLPGYILGNWPYTVVNEMKQVVRHFSPIYDNAGVIEDFYLSQEALTFDLNCHITASYRLEPTPEDVYIVEKSDYTRFNFTARCTISYSSNSSIYHYFYTLEEGIWDLEKVWEMFRETVIEYNEIEMDWHNTAIMF